MILFGLLLILLALLGAPLFTVIAASALMGFQQSDIDLTVVLIEFFRIAEMPVLLAIPLFTFAGYVLGESNAPQRLVRLTTALVGWMPGGLAIISLVACALFTAFTGASGITIVALGALLYPALKHAGYKENFSLGLVTTSGSLGLLFAPALPLILYAVVTQQLGLRENISVDAMFLAGILPGVLMLVLLSSWSIWHNRHHFLPKFSLQETRSAVIEAAWEIPLPIVILGVSLASTNYLIDAEIPTRLFETIRELVKDKLTFLLLLNLFLLVLGTMLDIFSALVLMVPLLLPIALGYGIDPVHLGIIFLANMQIGYFTPPVGMNLFIASYRFNKPIMQLYRATLPWFLILFGAVLIITYWPWLSLALLGRG